MKKFKKILSLMVAVVSIFMVGFATVKADEAPKSIVVKKGVTWYSGNYNGAFWEAYVKGAFDAKGNWQFAFCLDSEKHVYYDSMSLNSTLYSDKVDAVNKIINKALRLGLGTGANQFGISDADFYGVTQTVVWKAVHGEGTDGYTARYQEWISKKGYKEIFNTLWSATSEGTAQSSVNINGTAGMKEDGNYLVSNDYKIETVNVPSGTNLNLKVTGGEVYYNGAWTSNNVTVQNGSVIKVRASKPSTGSGNVSVTISVDSDSFNSGFNTYFYGAPSGKQNIGVVIPKTDKVSKSITVNGNYKNVDYLDVSKTDATSGAELPGAKLTIKNNKGGVVDSWTSTEEEHRVSGLEVGAIYELIEEAAPKGYDPLKNEIYFILNKDGSVTTCDNKTVDMKKGICNAMSTEDKLNIKNEVSKNETTLDVSKTDATGQKELPGAKLTIKDSEGKVVTSWTSTEEEHRVSGLEVGAIYEIVEDYAPEGYTPLQNSIKFVLNADGSVTTCDAKTVDMKKGICNAMSTEDKLNIKNEVTKLEVSKTDATGQKELAGASLTIKDKTGKTIDTWVSEEGKTHTVSGLVIGDIYEIVEDYAPKGYEPLQNSIKFVLNADGSVTTCDAKTVDMKNGICNAMSTEDILKIKNEVLKTTKVVITKRDVTNGEEIPGAHLQIIDENGNIVDEWTSTDEPHEIEGLKVGKYILIETLPAADYNAEMIINGNRTSKYEFEVKEGEVTKIDVYNELIGVPNTGISISSTYVIGGLAMLAGVGTVMFARKKEMI